MASNSSDRARVLSKAEYLVEAEPVFNAIFASGDPYDEPIQPSIRRRGLLYPSGPVLEAIYLQAVAVAARAVGDRSVFLSVTNLPSDAPPADRTYDWHWQIGLTQMDAYYDLDNVYGQETALYSPAGLWGILCSYEHYSLVAGDPAFVDALYAQLAVPEAAQTRRLISDTKGDHEQWGWNIAWVPRVLIHIYGEERTEALLKEADWPPDPATWVGRYPPPTEPP